jgi:hypothetical protein
MLKKYRSIIFLAMLILGAVIAWAPSVFKGVDGLSTSRYELVSALIGFVLILGAVVGFMFVLGDALRTGNKVDGEIQSSGRAAFILKPLIPIGLVLIVTSAVMVFSNIGNTEAFYANLKTYSVVTIVIIGCAAAIFNAVWVSNSRQVRLPRSTEAAGK